MEMQKSTQSGGGQYVVPRRSPTTAAVAKRSLSLYPWTDGVMGGRRRVSWCEAPDLFLQVVSDSVEMTEGGENLFFSDFSSACFCKIIGPSLSLSVLC